MLRLPVLFLFLAPLLSMGCSRFESGPPPEAIAATKPIVYFRNPEIKNVDDYLEVVGRVAASRMVEIRSPAGGMIVSTKMYSRGEVDDFREGSAVKAGDVLFVVAQDPVTAVRWMAEQADPSVKPESPAMPKFLEIRSPIAGIVGKRQIDPGNLLPASSIAETVLTTVAASDPAYVYFHVDESVLLKLLRQRNSNAAAGDVTWSSAVAVAMADEDGFTAQGNLDYVDNRIDPETSSIEVRASLPNPKSLLYPGMSVRVRLSFAQINGATLVEEKAIRSDRRGRYLYVVNHSNEIEKRYVITQSQHDGMRVVKAADTQSESAAIKPDDRYVVQAWQPIQPGDAVQASSIEEESFNRK